MVLLAFFSNFAVDLRLTEMLMRNFTLKLWAAGSLLLALLLGTQTVAAAEFPAIEELYGRYRFSGELTWEDGTENPEIPVPATDYEMVVLPDTAANKVRILGFLGLGNGIVATYDAATGTLSCDQEAAFLCANIDYFTFTGLQVALDGGDGGSLGYTYSVTEENGVIQLTSLSQMNGMYMDLFASSQAMFTYASGYTLTKEDISVSLSSASGTYSFTGNKVVSTSLPDVSEIFELTLSDAGDGKVSLKGLYGIDEEVEATYFEDGGLVLLPEEYSFSNGLYWGQMTMDVMVSECAPYLYVEDGKLYSPCSFFLYGPFDEMMGGAPTFSFIGGEAVKKADGDGIASYHNTADGICVSDGVIYVTNAEEAPVVVYDLAGVKVAEANGASVAISGLQSGIYVVKAGNRTAKVALK